MKKICFIILVEGLFLCTIANAQVFKKDAKLPEHIFDVHIGDSIFQKRLSEYKNRFILIDFWSKDCTDCIASMPKMLAFHERFKDSLAILLVTTNTEKEISFLFSKFKGKEKTSKWVEAGEKLPIVYNDTFFSKLFPFKVLPAHVWIKKSLLFHAMAYPTSATAENLSAWMRGNEILLDEMVIREIDPLDPMSLLTASKDNLNAPISYSLLLKRIEFGMGTSAWVTYMTDSVSGKLIGITCLNSSIIELYKTAYRNSLKLGYIIPDYRIKLNTTKEIKWEPDLRDPENSDNYRWSEKHSFCYTLKLGPASKEDLYTLMQKDLDRSFDLQSSLVKTNIKCRILKAVRQESLSNHNRALQEEKYIATEKELSIQNLPFEQLYLAIKSIADIQKWSMPFLNEVSYNENISLALTWSKPPSEISLIEINDKLKKYGLIITEEYRIMDVLVIKDAENNSSK